MEEPCCDFPGRDLVALSWDPFESSCSRWRHLSQDLSSASAFHALNSSSDGIRNPSCCISLENQIWFALRITPDLLCLPDSAENSATLYYEHDANPILSPTSKVTLLLLPLFFLLSLARALSLSLSLYLSPCLCNLTLSLSLSLSVSPALSSALSFSSPARPSARTRAPFCHYCRSARVAPLKLYSMKQDQHEGMARFVHHTSGIVGMQSLGPVSYYQKPEKLCTISKSKRVVHSWPSLYDLTTSSRPEDVEEAAQSQNASPSSRAVKNQSLWGPSSPNILCVPSH